MDGKNFIGSMKIHINNYPNLLKTSTKYPLNSMNLNQILCELGICLQ